MGDILYSNYERVEGRENGKKGRGKKRFPTNTLKPDSFEEPLVLSCNGAHLTSISKAGDRNPESGRCGPGGLSEPN